jgi:hypothetical protein
MPAMLPACDAPPALVTALFGCCCPACPQPQHPSATTSLLPMPRLSSVLSATDQEPEGGVGLRLPPLLKCLVSTRHQKFRLYRFVPRKTPAWNTPPASTLPQNIIPKFCNRPFSRTNVRNPSEKSLVCELIQGKYHPRCLMRAIWTGDFYTIKKVLACLGRPLLTSFPLGLLFRLWRLA